MKINSVPIEEEFRKNSALKKEDIEALRKWCDEKSYPPRASDSDLAIFLHASYYYLDTAKLNLENYYVTRRSLPQFFDNRDLSSLDLKKILDTIVIIPLEQPTREGYKVILIRPLDIDQKQVLCADAIKALNMVLDLNIHEEGTQKGYVFVVDVHGSNFFAPDSFDASSVKKYFEYLQKSAPIRWFGMHFINTLLPFDQSDPFTRMTIVQNEYSDATYLHLDLDSLNEIVPLEALPNEMGGKAGPLKDLHSAQMTKIRNKSFWFLIMDIQEVVSRHVHEQRMLLSKCLTTLSQDLSRARLGV